MKTNPNHHTGFASYSDRALAETANMFYYAISNNTELANLLPAFEAFNAARLAFMEALEKANSRTRDDIAAKNVQRHKLAIEMAALKDYVPLTAHRYTVKLEKPGFYNPSESRPHPVRRKPSKAAAEKPGRLLLATMFLKIIQGMRSYWHAAGSTQHL